MNQYIVNEPQAKAINDGASILIVEIDDPRTIDIIENQLHDKRDDAMLKKFLLPIKQGEEIFIADSDGCRIIGLPHFKVGEVSVKKVQDILDCDDLMDSLLPNNWQYVPCHSIEDDYSFNQNEEIGQKREKVFINWLKDQGIDYNANPWVALAELKGL